jgi:endonuclease/exonuclease/phosphatase family metal-dependent hydrolase
VANCNLHLERKESDALRDSQLCEVLADIEFKNGHRPTLIVGDLNKDAADGQASAALKRAGFRGGVRLPDVRTRLSRGVPDQGWSIDSVFLAGGLKMRDGSVHKNVRASDHVPFCAALSFTWL